MSVILILRDFQWCHSHAINCVVMLWAFTVYFVVLYKFSRRLRDDGGKTYKTSNKTRLYTGHIGGESVYIDLRRVDRVYCIRGVKRQR